MTYAEDQAHKTTSVWASMDVAPIEALRALGWDWNTNQYPPTWDDVELIIATIITVWNWVRVPA